MTIKRNIIQNTWVINCFAYLCDENKWLLLKNHNQRFMRFEVKRQWQFAARSVNQRHGILPPSKTSSGQTSRPEPAGQQPLSQTPPRPPGPSCPRPPSLVPSHYLMQTGWENGESTISFNDGLFLDVWCESSVLTVGRCIWPALGEGRGESHGKRLSWRCFSIIVEYF